MRVAHEKEIAELKQHDKYSQEDIETKRKEFKEQMARVIAQQRIQDIMGHSESEDEEAKLDVADTFKQFVSQKKFGAEDRHLTFKDYYKLNFENDVPEIVCEVIHYLSGQLHHRTSHISKDTYIRMLNAQMEGKVIESEGQKERKRKFGWRYTFEGLEQQIQKLSPRDIIRNRNRVLTEEQKKEADEAVFREYNIDPATMPQFAKQRSRLAFAHLSAN